MTHDRKPRVFIGSSRESINYARAISAHLERFVEVNAWYAGTFRVNEYTMESLERELDTNDFGVFIFSADDIAKIRDKVVFVTRDNTIFEMGMFWGRLRKKRVFAIIPREIPSFNRDINGEAAQKLHILSDLSGITLLEYSLRDDGNDYAAVDTACGKILQAIDEERIFQDPHTMLQRKQSILRFFWEYLRITPTVDPVQRYSALAEATRNSFLAPSGFRILGAAIWKRIDDTHIGQVGGNVGRGRIFHLNANDDKSNPERKVFVVDVFNTGEWAFYGTRDVANVFILCYPLGTEHVLSAHISGDDTLTKSQLTEVVEANNELLLTITHLIGGDIQ